MRAEGEGSGLRLRVEGLETSALVFAALFPTFGTILYFVVFSEGTRFRIAYLACKVIQFGFPVAWVLLVRGRGNPGRLRSGDPVRSDFGVAPRGGNAPSRNRAAGDGNHSSEGAKVEAGGAAEQEEGAGSSGVRIGRGLVGHGSVRWMARGFVTGALMAVAIGACYLLVLRGGSVASSAAGRVAERLDQMGASTFGRYAVLAIFISIAHSWLEEYYWRWFLFGRLRPRTGVGPAVILSSLAFTAHHVVVLWAYMGSGPAAWMVLPLATGVALGGAVWARLFERSGSILPGWISHVLADLAIMAMGWDLAGGAPDG